MIRIFRFFVPASTLGLLLFESAVTVCAFLFSTYRLLNLDPDDYLLNNLGWLSIAFVSLSFLAGLYVQDLYSQVRVKSKLLLLQQLMMAVGIVFLLQALISVAGPNLYLPLPIVFAGSTASLVIIFIGRLLFHSYVLPRVVPERLLLIGDSPILADIAGHLEQHPQLGIQVAGCIGKVEFSGDAVTVPGLAEPFKCLEDVARHFSSRTIVAASPGARLAAELLELRFVGYAVYEASATYARISNREGLSGMNAARLLCLKEFEPGVRDVVFQRIADMVLAAAVILVSVPVMMAIAVMVRISFHGPALERRKRMGRNQSPFFLYSFRVCPDGAELEPEVTFMGRFLRRTGLYALPQLFNVLRGELAIVGPQPHRPEFHVELTRHIPFYPHRLKVRPGITGLAQIEKRRGPAIPDAIMELEYDLYYLKNASPMMSLFITLQSLKNVIVWGGQP